MSVPPMLARHVGMQTGDAVDQTNPDEEIDSAINRLWLRRLVILQLAEHVVGFN